MFITKAASTILITKKTTAVKAQTIETSYYRAFAWKIVANYKKGYSDQEITNHRATQP